MLEVIAASAMLVAPAQVAATEKTTSVQVDEWPEKPDAASLYLLVGPAGHVRTLKLDPASVQLKSTKVFRARFEPTSPMWERCELEDQHQLVVVGPVQKMTKHERVRYLGLATVGGDPYLPHESMEQPLPPGHEPSFAVVLERSEVVLERTKTTLRMWERRSGKPWQLTLERTRKSD
jgi:hypothetical protein